jgi:hypothetical protein
MTAVSLADWAAFLSLGTSVSAAVSIPFHLFVDAKLADFDPRPAVRRALDTDLGARLVVETARARDGLRDTGQNAAALVILLTTSPKGAMA